MDFVAAGTRLFFGLDGGTSGAGGLTDIADVTVEGFIAGIGGTLVYSDVFPQSTCTFATFDTVNLLGKSVDTVVISLGHNGSAEISAYVDNIRLDPDPGAASILAPLALMVHALFGIATLRHRRSIDA